LKGRHFGAGAQRRGRLRTAERGDDSDQTDHSVCQQV
jgi:hypothetical protein